MPWATGPANFVVCYYGFLIDLKHIWFLFFLSFVVNIHWLFVVYYCFLNDLMTSLTSFYNKHGKLSNMYFFNLFGPLAGNFCHTRDREGG